MYKLKLSSAYKKSYRRMAKRGYDMSLLHIVIEILLRGEELPEQYKDHSLQGSFAGFHECHIKPDWLLIYLIEDDVVTLTLVNTGTHSDLFKK